MNGIMERDRKKKHTRLKQILFVQINVSHPKAGIYVYYMNLEKKGIVFI